MKSKTRGKVIKSHSTLYTHEWKSYVLSTDVSYFLAQINSVFLLIGLRVVMSSVPTRDASFFSRVRTWLKSSAVLVCLLGVTWVFGLLFLKDSRTTVFAYIFTIMNSLQVGTSTHNSWMLDANMEPLRYETLQVTSLLVVQPHERPRTSTSNGGCRREEKSRNHWSLQIKSRTILCIDCTENQWTIGLSQMT